MPPNGRRDLIRRLKVNSWWRPLKMWSAPSPASLSLSSQYPVLKYICRPVPHTEVATRTSYSDVQNIVTRQRAGQDDAWGIMCGRENILVFSVAPRPALYPVAGAWMTSAENKSLWMFTSTCPYVFMTCCEWEWSLCLCLYLRFVNWCYFRNQVHSLLPPVFDLPPHPTFQTPVVILRNAFHRPVW